MLLYYFFGYSEFDSFGSGNRLINCLMSRKVCNILEFLYLYLKVLFSIGFFLDVEESNFGFRYYIYN